MIALTGYYGGLALVWCGAFETDRDTFYDTFVGTAFWLTLGTAFYASWHLVSRNVLLSNILRTGNGDDLARGNVAVAVVEACSLVATGNNVATAFGRDQDSIQSEGQDRLPLWVDVLLSAGFFVLAQLMLFALARLHQAVAACRYSELEQVRKGNIAVAIAYGGQLLAFGLLISCPFSRYLDLVLRLTVRLFPPPPMCLPSTNP